MVARQVLATDPTVLADLATVRLGTAQFRRVLIRLADEDFDGPSLLAGWSRRHVIAHVGYNARAIARLVTWAATGQETPMYPSPETRAAEIEAGATLRPDALRSLCEHAAMDLDVRWRDLPEARWSETVRTAQGRTVPVSETLWMRTREVWLHAVDLDAGARFDEIPPGVLARLLGDVVGAWEKRGELGGLSVTFEGPEGAVRLGDLSGSREVTGTLVDVVEWATGRAGPSDHLKWVGEMQPAPRWL
jgi:maleylpyruvate isomerase